VHRFTGFAFAGPADLPETPTLDGETLSLPSGPVKEKLAQAYPPIRGAASNYLRTQFSYPVMAKYY
jgi:hypothetical protein